MKRAEIAILCAASLSGCATLVSDDHQSIAIKSDPPGATCMVHQGGVDVGTIPNTPGTIYVGKSRHDLAIDCAKFGYYNGAAILQPEFQDWTYGNILYGGSIGLLVDTSTGAINEYPRAVTVLMRRVPRPGERPEETERLSAVESARQDVLRHRQ
jgi:hypothetical protein